jgi:hypothetical protein
MATSVTDGSSIALVHYADRSLASCGDTIFFTAWILNDSKETLTDVSISLCSLTNGASEKVSYSTGPNSEDLCVPSLAPGESMKFGFTYVVTQADVAYGGEIISAMQVRARSNSGIHRDECDAIVRCKSQIPEILPEVVSTWESDRRKE